MHTISGIAAQTNQEIAKTSVDDSATALEGELVRALRQQTISLGSEINQKLHQVTAETTVLRDQAEFLYAHPDSVQSYPYPSTYQFSPQGSYGSIIPNNNSWLLVSSLALDQNHQVPKRVMDEVNLTEWVDPLFRTIAENDPNAVQLYINTKSQITRGMPFEDGTFKWVDATIQFPSDINLPEYDFFYLANETNNPGRDTVWTTLYYDPAGLGWMISSISPVYSNDSLQAVVGIDITLDRIISSILNVTIEKTGFAFLISDEGNLIAFPERAGPFLGFSGSLSGTFQRDEQLQYNMSESPDPAMRTIISKMLSGADGVEKYTHYSDNKDYFIAYAPINETGWSIGVVAPAFEVTEPSRLMSEQIEGSIKGSSDKISGQINGIIFNNIIIIILILLAMIPTAFMLTRMISNPIRTLIEGSKRIGAGDLSHGIEVTTHDELEVLATSFNAMARDLDQKLTELEEVNRELRDMDELKSQFISIASHELRTPLIAMKGYIDLLLGKTKGDLTPEQVKMLTIVARNTARLGRIISEILDMSRIEANRLTLTKEWFSLPEVIDEVGEELSTSIKKRGHTYSADIPKEFPLIYGDRDRIAQVIINLLGNAIKYTPDQGKISIKAYSKTDRIFIDVQDTGIGISAEDIPHIFTRFYQVTSVTSHKTGKDEFLAGGTGLGLAIVKGIIEAHDGEILVHSTLGKGTTFQVILPLTLSEAISPCKTTSDTIIRRETESDNECLPLGQEKPEIIEDDQEKEEISEMQEPARILVIDDEPDTLEFILDLLSVQYTIITANSGATGLKKALQELPDLILLDAWMPGITGYDVCRTLKKNPKSGSIPIIIVTAAVGQKDETAAQLSGADAFLAKPFENEALLTLIRDMLIKRRK